MVVYEPKCIFIWCVDDLDNNVWDVICIVFGISGSMLLLYCNT